MKALKKFLESNELTYRQFAKAVRAGPGTICKLLQGHLPSMNLAMKIEKATMKKVTLYSWFESEPNKATDRPKPNNKSKKNNKA